ncbi:Sensor protein ZraS [Novipirellula aureliae]|uniref:histidine kinase n=1 Tax=Novipirellula aureliae TaxID=2527966 RepID=A0A5C6DFE4_9BACT|nr:ATP-binding protein [Novipirellula aureliae]TWU34537.1 Sensor protein ZraS [Novipirellula aureliae]
MFRVSDAETSKSYRLVIALLLILSVTALLITIWVMVDFLKERQIVHQLISQLPAEARDSGKELESELKWQFRLSSLIVLNSIVTGAVMALLWRALKTSQRTLRDLKTLAGDILSSLDQGVITTDEQGLVTSINDRGLELLSITEDPIGIPIRNLTETIGLPIFHEPGCQCGTHAETRDFAVQVNDSVQTLRTFVQSLRNHEDIDIGCIIQLRDVTERVLIEEQMRRMERYMGLGTLAAGLRHEIENPLTALSLHLQLLDEHLRDGDVSPETNDMLIIIKTEIQRTVSVLENFRDFASMGRLNLSPVDLREVVERQTTLLTPQAQKQKIDLHVEIERSFSGAVQADAVRIEQVILNLLVNAIDAMKNGGQLTVRLSAQPSGRDLGFQRVEVIDTGPGIPDKLKARIFDPYFTTKPAGTGMGLALCDKIVRQHHGNLSFHRSFEGTVFEFTLPYQPQ